MTKSRSEREKKLNLETAIDMGTEQTRKRLKVDPVVSMAQGWRVRGFRDGPQLESAAREIRRIYIMVAGGMMPKAVDLSSVKGASVPISEWLAQRRRDIYIPFCQEIGADFGIIVSWLIDEVPLSEIDRAKRKRNGYASELIVRHLTRYCVLSGTIKNTPTIM